MSKITAHMIIKNEDRWVWFAIKSVLPFVDEFLITDTGSTDNTVKTIKSIKSKKIKFNKKVIKSAKQVTDIRQEHIDKTKSGWIWTVDGDEIYPSRLCKEIVKKIKNKSLTGILVKRFDLLGDVYNKQSESVGSYNLLGYTGHVSTRLVNLNNVKGLKYYGDYPLEGYYDKDRVSLKEYPKKLFSFTKHRYWHAGYLVRSSIGGNLKNTINRSKIKIEKGTKIKDKLPEIFFESRPSYIEDPLLKRGLIYELLSIFVTPIKILKRKLL